MEDNSITVLASNCLLVKGFNKNLLIDFQNDEWYHVDFQLLEGEEIDLSLLKKEELDHLLNRQILIQIPSELRANFTKFRTDFNVPSIIESAIIDRNETSIYNILNALKWLDSLVVKFCQIRFYSAPSLTDIDRILEGSKKSHLESIDFLVPYSDLLENYFEEKLTHFPKINLIVFHSSEKNLLENDDASKKRIFIKEIIKSSDKCGNAHPNFFSQTKKHVLKSLNYNSCLYKKIGIDVDGEIKNCPSMIDSFGNIENVKNINNENLTTEYWNIKKDDIEICKDCEFRYICADCRVQVDHKYARPNTCIYNPYTNKWKGQEGYTEPISKDA